MGRANLQEPRENCSRSLEKIPLCSLPHDLAAGVSGFFMEGCLGQNGSACEISDESQELIRVAMTELNLSARAYDRILKVSRTVADLAASDSITPEHVSEAIRYRTFDRSLWV
jgi:hypothetical protein